MRFRTFIVSIFTFSHLIGAFSQDLIKNGDFEELKECPKGVSMLAEKGLDLSLPTSGTTDLFSTCATGKVAAPKNFRGVQTPKSGATYAGLYLYSPNNYREYIQFSFKETLKKGGMYQLRFFVSLSETSTYGTGSLNVVFTGVPVHFKTTKNISKSRLASSLDKLYSFHSPRWRGSYMDMENWVEVTLEFQAKGFEKHLILGNFNTDQTTKGRKVKKPTRITKEFSYYYLDDMTLTRIDGGQEPEQDDFVAGEAYVINGVRFATGSHELTEVSKKEINKLYQRLKELPLAKLSINGHTDDVGSKLENEFLSHRRARAVANYLVELGFSDERILWQGHGDTKPLVNKVTKDARMQNRRVDFVITEFEDNQEDE